MGPLAVSQLTFKRNQCSIRQISSLLHFVTTTSHCFVGMGGIAEIARRSIVRIADLVAAAVWDGFVFDQADIGHLVMTAPRLVACNTASLDAQNSAADCGSGDRTTTVELLIFG